MVAELKQYVKEILLMFHPWQGWKKSDGVKLNLNSVRTVAQSISTQVGNDYPSAHVKGIIEAPINPFLLSGQQKDSNTVIEILSSSLF
ncbi:MAG: hypothetical protein EZS28_009206 [Streblomastix strix]|uniref:Uncharacterized protein n=1 Tax=Streblomastix strix TaxID=222440 RepID=A0A5J4WLX4_9EUKA|nr:MAG: hypothetical protein EZS28_009206 [Streblomastix strix]